MIPPGHGIDLDPVLAIRTTAWAGRFPKLDLDRKHVPGLDSPPVEEDIGEHSLTSKLLVCQSGSHSRVLAIDVEPTADRACTHMAIEMDEHPCDSGSFVGIRHGLVLHEVCTECFIDEVVDMPEGQHALALPELNGKFTKSGGMKLAPHRSELSSPPSERPELSTNGDPCN